MWFEVWTNMIIILKISFLLFFGTIVGLAMIYLGVEINNWKDFIAFAVLGFSVAAAKDFYKILFLKEEENN